MDTYEKDSTLQFFLTHKNINVLYYHDVTASDFFTF